MAADGLWVATGNKTVTMTKMIRKNLGFCILTSNKIIS
jgi:hypothetical protein